MGESSSGHVKRTLHSDWLLEWARWNHLLCPGNPVLFPQEKVFFWPCNKSTKLVQSRQLDVGQYRQYPAILTKCWSITHNYLEQWLELCEHLFQNGILYCF